MYLDIIKFFFSFAFILNINTSYVAAYVAYRNDNNINMKKNEMKTCLQLYESNRLSILIRSSQWFIPSPFFRISSYYIFVSLIFLFSLHATFSFLNHIPSIFTIAFSASPSTTISSPIPLLFLTPASSNVSADQDPWSLLCFSLFFFLSVHCHSLLGVSIIKFCPNLYSYSLPRYVFCIKSWTSIS